MLPEVEYPLTDEVDRLQAVLEGGCPDCGADTEISQIGGYPEWLHRTLPSHPVSGYNPGVTCPYDLDGVELNEWTRPDPDWDTMRYDDSFTFESQGSVTFRCPSCGQTHYVEAHANGDWS